MDIKALHKEGHSIKQIARQTGYSRNTVRRVLREPAPAGFQSPERSSCLDPYKAYLQDRWQTTGLNAVRLLAEIQHMGYGGYLATLRRYLATLRRYLATLKPAQERLQKLTVRFESPPVACFTAARIGSKLGDRLGPV
jgi:transposase